MSKSIWAMTDDEILAALFDNDEEMYAFLDEVTKYMEENGL
jgi:hypothetical protein